ncbi:Sct2 glycerol-3-phosphate acyltransferase [Scheffersomyces coipomensis]|uniref:Sct2 glycerol-3-phosphate acyltransferase n=1 Tax=Scheffersomyces coipomensis TaxID=1788519 RepID=UPI00315CA597
MKLEDSSGLTSGGTGDGTEKSSTISSSSIGTSKQSSSTSNRPIRQRPSRSISDLFHIIFGNFTYDLVLWFFSFVIHTFFRDIQPRGTFNIPNHGPIIFVIAPHHNQFIDPLIVMSKVKESCGRRIANLIANRSYQRMFIGTSAKLCGAIPVERAQDLLKLAQGEIKVDPNDNTKIIGVNTKFTIDCMERGLIGLPESLGNVTVKSIEDDTHLTLKKPFESPRSSIQIRINTKLENGTKFKVAPHIDNSIVFRHVFDHLNSGKVLGIFPEGGSHDRPDLLPLKPGVAIMALGTIGKAIQDGQSQDQIEAVNIIPVGLNYFHAHKFRSRVVVEFGKPIIVDYQMGQKYLDNSKSQVEKLLNLITLNLKEVTVTCNDYETLMVLQATRRLYTSSHRDSIPLPMVVDLNRRLIKGYDQFKSDPDVIELKEQVLAYNNHLVSLGLHDHQVSSLMRTNRLRTLIMFMERFFKFCLYMGLSLPGAILFSPVFITASRISHKKAKEALAGSVVKIKAKDVLGTWKILVALVLAPMLYIFYSIIGTILILKYTSIRQFNIPILFIFLFCYGWAVLTTYASLRVGEIGVDYYKSLIPLFISIISYNNDQLQIEALKQTRYELSLKVDKFCNKFGPGLFEDYDEFYREYNVIDETDYKEQSPFIQGEDRGSSDEKSLNRTSSMESFNIHNLSDVPIFSNIPDSGSISAKPSYVNLTSIGNGGDSNNTSGNNSSIHLHPNYNNNNNDDVSKKLRDKLKSKFKIQ